MKTAMQRMLDDLIEKRNVYENAKMYQSVATLETSIEIARYLLEKEKEQIIEAFEYGQINVNEDGCLSEENGAEEYYNQTYNQNK